MHNQLNKITTMLSNRNSVYKQNTAEILNELQFAVDGIQHYFLQVGMHVYVEDVNIIQQSFVFVVVVNNTISEVTQAFHIGIPIAIMNTNSTTNICDFLIKMSTDNSTQSPKKPNYRLH